MQSPWANVKDLAARILSRSHEQLFRATKGRIGGTGFGMPVLMLGTIGRKSGKLRTTMLTSPVQEGDTLVLVASYGGDNRHPTWFLNLRDNPAVEVTMRGSTRKMKAHVASIDEKARLWPKVTEKYGGYAAYQRRTDRDIPLVILEPAV
ncbi:MAG TPA: nitroreductase family deazaflavin-dependent oxidoreductase [Actinomycetota bacterium]|nr:nitroreductase family deazaflavin-dependent oxidoreductase [Actinomycetota bacterium]